VWGTDWLIKEIKVEVPKAEGDVQYNEDIVSEEGEDVEEVKSSVWAVDW